MAFHFSAMQYERGFAPKSVSNWEYQRFFPPRPRLLLRNSKPLVDKTGHLLPTARRDGNFLGQYRGTYHLPRHITREFATNYNRCLSGQYKYRDYPRDLCCCEFERNKGNCDWRLTLGRKGDPVWDKPVCQTKCEGLQMLLDINNQHKHCRHAKCLPRGKEKLIQRPADSSMRNRKRNRKRQVTAFDFNKRQNTDGKKSASKTPKEAETPAATTDTPAQPAQPQLNKCDQPVCSPGCLYYKTSPCCLPQDYSVCPPVNCPPSKFCS